VKCDPAGGKPCAKSIDATVASLRVSEKIFDDRIRANSADPNNASEAAMCPGD